MIIIVEVKSALNSGDEVQVSNFLGSLTHHLIINGRISLIDKYDPFYPISNLNDSIISGSNPEPYDIRYRFDSKAPKPSYPLFYRVNVCLSTFIPMTKKELEILISNKSGTPLLDRVRIVKYSFEPSDNFPQNPAQFFTNLVGPLKELFIKYKLKTEQSIPFIDVVFRRAAAKGNVEDLTTLIISKRVDINSQDTTPGKHYTALHWAAKNEHVHAYNLLIFNGANPHITDASNHEPSYYLKKSNPEKTSSFDYSRIFQ